MVSLRPDLPVSGEGRRTMIVTAELIEQGKSCRGGWTKAQLAILGVKWPPPKGWKARVIGWKEISDSAAEEFVRLKGQERSTLERTRPETATLTLHPPV